MFARLAEDGGSQPPLHIHAALQPSPLLMSTTPGGHWQQEAEAADAVSMLDFETVGFLGAGSVGRVYLARRRNDARLYALKAVPKTGHAQVERAKEERRILQQLRHPFIVSLNHAFEDGQFLYLAMSYAGSGDLRAVLDEEQRVTDETQRAVLSEVVSALCYLHSAMIIYRDLKPENVLIGQDGHILLADFGISKRLRKEPPPPDLPLGLLEAHGEEAQAVAAATTTTKTWIGTPEYMAPELVQRKEYSYSVDWWAAGVLLHELALGHTPFAGATVAELVRLLRNPDLAVALEEEDEAAELPPATRALIGTLLQTDVGKRLGCGRAKGSEEVKEHPYFGGVDWARLEAKDGPEPAPFERLPSAQSSGQQVALGGERPTGEERR